MQHLALKTRVRNCLRAAGVEIVTIRAGSNLLGLHLKLLFSAYEISCILDVGAHRGEYGLWLRRNGYRGDIVSFEPVQENFLELARVAAGDPKWHFVNYALGAENTMAPINVAFATVFSSFHTPNATALAMYGRSPTVQRSEQVEVRRLDTVLDTLPLNVSNGRIYLKLDTQGWDLEVLAGALGVLNRISALQTEVSVQPIYEGMPAMADSLAAIAERGFVPSGFFPVNFDQRFALMELDLVAVRKVDSARRV
jgi:FkbM family methyltransferase